MWRPVARESSQVGLGDLLKTFECHRNYKGNTIEEWIVFKNVVRHLLDMVDTKNIWGEGAIIVCDEPRIDIPVTEVPCSIICY